MNQSPPPIQFERRNFGAYTDSQLKYIRLGWNAAMKAVQQQDAPSAPLVGRHNAKDLT